jgi:hypothetical protein
MSNCINWKGIKIGEQLFSKSDLCDELLVKLDDGHLMKINPFGVNVCEVRSIANCYMYNSEPDTTKKSLMVPLIKTLFKVQDNA